MIAALHIHSDWSYDGSWSLTALATEFGRRRYRVIMMTEHDRGFTEKRRLEHSAACAAASTSEILVIPGIEYSDADNRIHVLVWGAVPFLGEGVPTTALLDAVRAANGLAVLAHPSRRQAWKTFDSAWSTKLIGVEVWNRKTDGWAPSLAALPLIQNSQLSPFVGMDFHTRRQMFPLAMELDIDSTPTEGLVLDCLRARRFRALAFGRPFPEAWPKWLAPPQQSVERCRRAAAACYRFLKNRQRS